MWFEQMHSDWQVELADWRGWLEQREADLISLEQAGTKIAPAPNLVMAAFALPPRSVRVVWLGQDPYPTAGVAVGRSFAVSSGAPVPASLRNIFTELTADLGCQNFPEPDLQTWQEQGVWLLNRHLTTTVGAPGSHQQVGWQHFTDAALRVLLRLETPLVLVLLGSQAQGMLKSLHSELAWALSHVRIVTAPHPSPLSAYRGFFGSRIFSQINTQLQSVGQSPVNWCL